jgi:hypothetical protein
MLEEITGRTLIASQPYDHADRYGTVVPGELPTPECGLDWSPRISLREGLEQSWDWARSRAGRQYLLQDALVTV